MVGFWNRFAYSGLLAETFAMLALFILGGLAVLTTEGAAKPNVLILFADDMVSNVAVHLISLCCLYSKDICCVVL